MPSATCAGATDDGIRTDLQRDISMKEPQHGIGRRIATGAGWLILARLAVRSLGFVNTLVLARLLMPEDFGLIALAMLALEFLELVTDFNFGLALISLQTRSARLYNTAWTLGVIRGVLVAAIMFLVARPYAAFFDEPRLEAILYVLTLWPLIYAFYNIGFYEFTRELDFQKHFKAQVVSKVWAIGVTIACAFAWRSYWAPIAGALTGCVAMTIMSYVMHPYRPRLALAEWRRLFDFSKWLALDGIITFAEQRTDTVILGKLEGSRTLGVYSVAIEIADLPTTQLGGAIKAALFPGYTKLTHDRAQLARAFVDALALVFLCALPLGAGVSLTAHLAVPLFLGARWNDAIPLLQILAIYGVINVLRANCGVVFLAVGKPRMSPVLSLIGLSVRAPLLIIGVLIAGAYGAAWAVLAGAAVASSTAIAFAARELGVSAAEIIRALWRPFAAAAVMACTVGFLVAEGPTLSGVGALGWLLAIATLGATIYVAAALALWRLNGSPHGPEHHAIELLRAGMKTWGIF